MTQRDEIATRALEAIIGNPTWNAASLIQLMGPNVKPCKVAAELAYEYADAMHHASLKEPRREA